MTDKIQITLQSHLKLDNDKHLDLEFNLHKNTFDIKINGKSAITQKAYLEEIILCKPISQMTEIPERITEKIQLLSDYRTTDASKVVAVLSNKQNKQNSIEQCVNENIHLPNTNICNTNNGQIELKTENSEIMIHFSNDNKLLEVKRKNELQHKVIYLDDAFKNTKIMSSLIYLTRTMSLITHPKDKELQNADSKDELSLIYEKIDNILNSDKSLFKTDKNDKSGASKLSLESLSSGVKVFYLIKSLIDTRIIVKNSTLILDAPETHLHPNLKIALAEIIVLLQKEMKLHILTNIYSPYFLRAIEVFSKKYDIEDTTKYYLSYNDGDNAKVKDVTLNISEIYKELSDPLQRLENENYREEL